MGAKSNVINFANRQKKGKKGSISDNLTSKAPILDMTERRNEIINRERREVKRTILTEFIGACAVVPEKGLQKVALYDVSESGLAFDLEMEMGNFAKGEEVAMRVYLNATTYFPFVVKIRHVREVEGEGLYRHGTHFIKETINDEALYHFIKFIETVSANLKSDRGDVIVSNLRR